MGRCNEKSHILKNLQKKAHIAFVLIVFFFCSSGNVLKAQNNDLQSGIANIGVASLLGGLGALVNIKKEEKLIPTILKGIGAGAIGGYLIFESKRVIRNNTRNEGELFWLAKLLNTTGNSVLTNATANRDFFERWFIIIGFNKLEVDLTKKSFLSYRLLPFALYGTVQGFTEGSFSPELSLRIGTPVFLSPKIRNNLGLIAEGKAIYNTVILLDNSDSKTVLRHEVIHTYQYENFMGINNFLKPIVPISVQEEPFFRTASAIFYLDLNAAFKASLITWQNQQVGYHKNIFEEEAYYFARE